jgi:hypothetical protein
MPVAFKGFGTIYYGEADRRPDGTYITTEWIVAAYAPVVPLWSLRVCRDRKNDVNIMSVRSDAYKIVERLPLQWSQIFLTYGFAVLLVFWVFVSTWLFMMKWRVLDGDHPILLACVYLLVSALPFICLSLMRRERYKSRHG